MEELKEIKKQRKQLNEQNKPGSTRMPKNFEEILERYSDATPCEFIKKENIGRRRDSGAKSLLWHLPEYLENRKWIILKRVKDNEGKLINGQFRFDKHTINRLDRYYKIQKEECTEKVNSSLLVGGFDIIDSWKSFDKILKEKNKGAEIEKRSIERYKNCELTEELKRIIPKKSKSRKIDRL